MIPRRREKLHVVASMVFLFEYNLNVFVILCMHLIRMTNLVQLKNSHAS